MRDRCPGLVGFVGLDGVGHWVQHEAAEQVNRELITFTDLLHLKSPTH